MGVLALAGCGSSQRGSYSPPQVESAFADHGIKLHPSDNRSVGIVLLVGRRGVRVLVDVGHVNRSVGWTGERPTVRGNVTVFRGFASGKAVEAALHELR